MSLKVEISHTEWEAAASLLQFADDDELVITGMVQLLCRGGRRRWTATDSVRLGSVLSEADHRDYEVLVSPRLVLFGMVVSEGLGSASLIVDDEGADPRGVTVSAGAESLTISADPRAFDIPVDDFLSDAEAAEGARVTLDASALRRLVKMASVRALPQDSDKPRQDPLFWVEIDGDGFLVRIGWAGLGNTTYRLGGEGEGSAKRAFPPVQIEEALEEYDGEVMLQIPDDPNLPLRIHGGARTVLVMPIDTTFEAERKRVEAVLSEVFGPDVLHRDSDGDYPLTVSGVPVYGRLVDDSPVKVQVFAGVLSDVERTPDLLQELNDHNASVGFVRTFWVDGHVLVESDLLASTLDPEEAVTAFTRVRQVAEELGPMLHAVHGGTLHVRDPEARWSHYGDTIIEAEAGPSRWLALAGPEAIEEWPYEGIVHVLTACNPFGRRRPAEANADANIELARILLHEGAGIARAMGRSADGGYAEPSLLAWGLDRDKARSIGRYFEQEAIFELDPQEVRVIACFDDRVEDYPRSSVSG